MKKWLVFLGVLFISFKIIAGTKLSSQEVLLNIQKFYNNVKVFQANFSQVYKNRIMGKEKESSGIVYIMKPGRMRWEYYKPEKKLIIADGTFIWILEEGTNQVIKRPLSASRLPTAVNFLIGKGELNKEFTAKILESSKLKATGKIILSLTPKEPSPHYARLVFVIDPTKNWQVEKTVIVDHQGNTNSFSFSNVRLNVELPLRLFEFKVPSGVTIVE